MSGVIATPEAPVVNVDPSASGQAPTPPAPPAPAPAPPAPKPDEKPPWLDERLSQAKKAALKEAGFDSPEAAKKAYEAWKAQEDAKKTNEEKQAALQQSLQATEAQLNETREALKSYAASQMSALTETQRAAVTQLAGDDAAKQLKTIEALRSTWAASAPAAPAAPAASSAPPPADTTVGKSMPRDPGAGPPPDHKAVWEQLKKTNPVLAARYAQENNLLNF